jgi:D-arabinono-1,4-lactone oxidase/FAD binding domain
MDIIAQAPDGFYHPGTEDELRALVVHAYEGRKKLRVRGSAHSVKRAIYTDGWDERAPAPGGEINVLLDRYRRVTITPDPADATHAIVEVEAGCHLGRDPYDPAGTSTWRNSLTYQLQQKGYALDDLGGISHQTISGFLSTGSSGGSLQHSIDDDILGIRLIDGTGKIWDLSPDDPNPAIRDRFFAAGCSMGLLGVISRVRLRAGPSYNIFGSQVTTAAAGASMDLFGPGGGRKPSLARFLRETPYSRLMWWPQRGFDRIQVWQAARMAPMSHFTPRPYQELGDAPELASLAGSLFYTLLGNLDDISRVPAKLALWYRHLEGDLEGNEEDWSPPSIRSSGQRYTVGDVLDWMRGRFEASLEQNGPLSRPGSESQKRTFALFEAARERLEGPLHSSVAKVITKLIQMILDGALDSPIARLLAAYLQKELPELIPDILAPFVDLGAQPFWDSWLSGLPMDNQMDDQLWPTEFTELWIPLEKTAEVMQALRAFYAGGGDAKAAYDHTGAFSCELYASTKSPFWMSPACEGEMFRVDVFWFALNAGRPGESFYPRFWELLRPFDFRPHWGKHLPTPSPDWQAYYKRCFPKMEAFLALRAEMDPAQIFVTRYWSDNLGIAPLV